VDGLGWQGGSWWSYDSFSAIHILMMDWRVTPRRAAARSRPVTTHAGKSTFTRRSSRLGRRMVVRSKYSRTPSPLSNFSSNSVAFIIPNHFFSRPSHRNDPDCGTSAGKNRRPVSPIDKPNRQIPHFLRNICRCDAFCQIIIEPKRLSSIKVDTVFILIRCTFGGFVFETHGAI